MYCIEEDHPAIIKREDWEAVQLEMDRRERFQKRHGIKSLGSPTYDRFFSKIFCGNCGGKYTRHYYRGIREAYWRCETCKTGRVMESSLKKAVADAWNTLVDHREEYLPDWERTAAQGDALERYYSRLMITATAEGMLEEEKPELTRLFLEEIKIISPEVLEVKFLTSHCLPVFQMVR